LVVASEPTLGPLADAPIAAPPTDGAETVGAETVSAETVAAETASGDAIAPDATSAGNGLVAEDTPVAGGSSPTGEVGETGESEAAPSEVGRRPQIGDTRPQIGDSRPAPARPRIGDTRPAALSQGASTNGSAAETRAGAASPAGEGLSASARRRRRRSGRGRPGAEGAESSEAVETSPAAPGDERAPRRAPARSRAERVPVEAVIVDTPAVVDQATLDRRRGRERKGRPVGRYLMVVHVAPAATQIAVLEGKSLIEHYVSRPADDANEIDGNIYLGRVQNVLPGMEAAFVDIGTPKNAVLYRGDVRYDRDDLESGAEAADKGKGKSAATKPTRGRLPGPARDARIENLLKNGQMILCQVTKNPIAHKGARLTQEVSLPGRFVVLIPGSDTYGISKRLSDEERKRLRRILDEVRPEGHGLIVRTAAEGATADELRRDVLRLKSQWDRIDELAKRSQRPGLLYREPGVAVRVIREEFNRNYRGVIIDDRELFEEVRDYVGSISPELADRVEYSGPQDDPLPVFERHHVHEQIHKALDRKVWLPSGGSLIIERTEALTVIDVNTGKNVGSSNLEETVFRNNLEAADEIARQLRLRDIGGIIVIDFIDMEIAANRNQVIQTFREALARDKTRTQVFDISELGLVEMTRKRVSEGLVESFSEVCPTCGGRGIIIDQSLL